MELSNRELRELKELTVKYCKTTGRLMEYDKEYDFIHDILDKYADEWIEDEVAYDKLPDLIDPDDITGDKINNLGIF